jgi:hypothetical protein
MIENFDRCFEFIMRWEGYKSNILVDAGGRTIFGISERYWPQVVKQLWDMPKAEARIEAKEFYREHYWQPAGCNVFSWPMDLIIFDTAVNMGLTRALLLSAGDNKPESYFMRRIRYYVAISKGSQLVFLRGWINRVLALWDEIQKHEKI